MSNYRIFSDVAQLAEFRDFVKTELGLDSVEQLSDVDKQGAFYMFKSRIGDLDESEIYFLNEIQEQGKTADFDALAKMQYGKSYDTLTTDEKIFVVVKDFEAKDMDVSLEDIEKILETEMKRQIEDETKDNISDVKLNNVNNIELNATPDVEPANKEKSDIIQETTLMDNNQENADTEILEDTELLRLRSADSDTNDYKINLLSYGILRKMNKIKELNAQEQKDQSLLFNEVKKAIDSLSKEENDFFNGVFYEGVVTQPVLLESIPPSVLADCYTYFKEKIEKNSSQINAVNEEIAAKRENNHQKLNELEIEQQLAVEKFQTVSDRIDELTEMLVRLTHYSKDLFFADNTNVADVYDGYKKMFDVRRQDLETAAQKQNVSAAANKMIADINSGQQALDTQYNSYLEFWNLAQINKENASDLYEHYQAMEKGLKKLELNNESASVVVMQNEQGQDVTLGELLNKVKFYRGQSVDDGALAPQFVDNNGNVSTEWQEGFSVIKGSQLDQTISIAKQLYVQENLGIKQDLSEAYMQTVMTEYVPQVLYIMNVKSEAARGILEKPEQYKDKATIRANVQKFMQNIDKTPNQMVIDGATFEGFKGSMADQAYAYRGVLAKQLDVGKNDDVSQTPILTNVCNHTKPIDPRAGTREIRDVTANVWQNYVSETVQGMAASAIGTFRVKGAQLLTVATTHAVTGIATAQLVLAASAIAPAALTVKQYFSWRKEQKFQGKSTNFKALLKDKNMLWTFGTTALTEMAVGCMFVPGMQPVGVALGASALAIGVSRAAVNDYKKLRKAGKGKFKAGSAAVLGAALKIGTALAVNKLMTDAFNKYFNEGKVEHREETKKETHSEIREKADLAIKARHTLESFYKGHNDILEQDLVQVREQLQALGRSDISPEAFLRGACDAGMNTGVDTVNHVDGGGVVHTQGNNLVMTDAWANQHGIDPNAVHNLANIRASDGTLQITPEAVAGFDAVKYNISLINEIGSTINYDGSRLSGHQDGVLDRNASVNEANQTVHAPKSEGTEFNTYANGESGYETQTITKTTTYKYDIHHHVNYEDTPAVGMLGIRNGGFISKMVERVGSLADKIIGKKDKKTTIIPEDKEKTKIPEGSGIKVNPTKKDYVKPEIKADDLLIDEYKLVHGMLGKNMDVQSATVVMYKSLVMEEFKADREQGVTKATNLVDYLKQRRVDFETAIATAVSPALENTKGFIDKGEGLEAVNKVRQEMYTTNLAFNGKDLPAGKMTLQKMKKLATYSLSNGEDRSKVKAARDMSRGSLPSGKQDKLHGGVLDLATASTTGQNQDKGIKDGYNGIKGVRAKQSKSYDN